MQSPFPTLLLGSALMSSTLVASGQTASSDRSDEYVHLHFSKRGTPIVHSFNVEPAFTGRDLFATGRARNGDSVDEQEMELELEWGFTRQFGIIVEMAGIREEELGMASREGWGDMALVPRVLLLEGERFMLTGQTEIVIPTGSHGFGGDTAIAPGLASWFDLGDWWTLNSQVGVEHVFDEDSNELIFGFGLVKTFGTADSHAQCEDGHRHATLAGLFHLHFEVTGAMGLNGEEEGDTEMEGLVGVSYGVSDSLDLRCGYEFPLTSTDEFDHGVVAGAVWHF